MLVQKALIVIGSKAFVLISQHAFVITHIIWVVQENIIYYVYG